MTKEQIELWTFLFNGLTAIGTLAAVIVSLWLSVRKTPAFVVSDIRVERSHTVDKDGNITKTDSYLDLTIENLREVRLEVFHVSVQTTAFKDAVKGGMLGQSIIIPFKDTFIPQLSKYSIRASLRANMEPGTFSIARTIECAVSTSFGEKVTKFPAAWRDRLCEALECEERVLQQISRM